MSVALTVLELGGAKVRHREAPNGELVFLHSDVCKVLGFGNPRQALASHVDTDDVQDLDTLTNGGKQRANWINEAAVNCLIFGSKLPEARKYTRAVAAFVAKVRRGEIEFAQIQDLATRVAAFIAEKTQEWELTFAKTYYAELDRLSGFKRTHANRHPHVYAQVTNKIYELLDPDVADHLKTVIPDTTKAGPKRHQELTPFGKKQLQRVLLGEQARMEMCSTLAEYQWYLDEKIARQLRLPLRLANAKRQAALPSLVSK